MCVRVCALFALPTAGARCVYSEVCLEFSGRRFQHTPAFPQPLDQEAATAAAAAPPNAESSRCAPENNISQKKNILPPGKKLHVLKCHLSPPPTLGSEEETMNFIHPSTQSSVFRGCGEDVVRGTTYEMRKVR